MANKLRIVANNYIDRTKADNNVTFTETPDSGTAENMQNYARSSVFTTSSYDTGGDPATWVHTLDIEFRASDLVSAIVLGRHNFPVGQEVRVTLFSDTGLTPGNEVYGPTMHTMTAEDAGSDIINWGEFTWGTIDWGEDTLAEDFAPKPSYVIWLDPVIAGSIKIELWTPNQDVEIGRLIIGDYIQPLYTTSYGHTISYQENTKQYRKSGNTLRSNEGIPARKFSFELKTIDTLDRVAIQGAMRHVGLRKDLFISLFPEDDDLEKTEQYSGIVKLTKIPSTSEYAPRYYKSKYEMEEV